MNKSKKEAIIVGILVVIFAVVLISNFKKAKHPQKKVNKNIPLAIKAEKLPSKSVKANTNIIVLQRERAKLPWGRDPFFFTKAKKAYKGRRLMLKGISLDKSGVGYAFINDEIVTVGDKVANYRVMEIKKDKVLLKRGSDTFYLAMPEE